MLYTVLVLKLPVWGIFEIGYQCLLDGREKLAQHALTVICPWTQESQTQAEFSGSGTVSHVTAFTAHRCLHKCCSSYL